MNRRVRSVVVVLGVICAAARADIRHPIDDLGVEWGGLRSALFEHGIDLHLSYVSETATNAQGGERELVRYADQLAIAAAFDLERLVELDQAKFQVTITDRNGRNLSLDAHLQSLQEVQEIYGRGQTWRWTQFFYEQKYLGGRLDWKVGRLVGGEDFADFSCEFMNLALCGPAPGNIAVKYWYNWPVSQWATRVKANIAGFGYLELGAFEMNPRFVLTRNGLNLGEPGGATGLLAPFEIGWLPRIDGRLAGSYKLGAWYNSGNAPDAVENRDHQPLLLDGGQALVRHGEYGGYVNFLQQLTHPASLGPQRGLSAFFNATFADRRTALVDSQIAVGLLYAGPFAMRLGDGVGIACGRTHVNSRVASAEALVNAVEPGTAAVQGSEYVGEIFYSVQVSQAVQLRPDLQYVYRPGGIAHGGDDVIVGIRLAVTL